MPTALKATATEELSSRVEQPIARRRLFFFCHPFLKARTTKFISYRELFRRANGVLDNPLARTLPPAHSSCHRCYCLRRRR
jgi:hypothetical protein